MRNKAHRKYTAIELSMIASYAETSALSTHERCGPCDICIDQFLTGHSWRGPYSSEGFGNCVGAPLATPDEIAEKLS